jgi:hypothetical protein
VSGSDLGLGNDSCKYISEGLGPTNAVENSSLAKRVKF